MGIWHHTMNNSDNRSIVDIVYFWLVTFTTVGFGDLGHSLEFEIDHAYDLTVYRVFGLSLVAAIIESLQSDISLRKEWLQMEALEQQKKFMEKIHSSMLASPIMCRGAINNDDVEDRYNVLDAIRLVAMNSLDTWNLQNTFEYHEALS